MRIFTNNPAVEAAYPDLASNIEGGVSAVFFAVRDAVHKGVQVLSHPLSGSIAPGESPYKSVVVSAEAGELDFASLQLIENAISMLNSQGAKPMPTDASTQEDYRIIDLDLINSAMYALLNERGAS